MNLNTPPILFTHLRLQRGVKFLCYILLFLYSAFKHYLLAMCLYLYFLVFNFLDTMRGPTQEFLCDWMVCFVHVHKWQIKSWMWNREIKTYLYCWITFRIGLDYFHNNIFWFLNTFAQQFSNHQLHVKQNYLQIYHCALVIFCSNCV